MNKKDKVLSVIEQYMKGKKTSAEIAEIAGCCKTYVNKIAKQLGFTKYIPRDAVLSHSKNYELGNLSAKRIAAITGTKRSYVAMVFSTHGVRRRVNKEIAIRSELEKTRRRDREKIQNIAEKTNATFEYVKLISYRVKNEEA